MKISDSRGMTIIDGQGTLTLTRNDTAVRLCNGASGVVIQNLHVQFIGPRIRATIAALRFVWCKPCQ